VFKVLQKAWREGPEERGSLIASVTVRFQDWKPAGNRHLNTVTDPLRLLQRWIPLVGSLDSGEVWLRVIGRKP